jgi:Family of unknown function (DUF5317)
MLLVVAAIVLGTLLGLAFGGSLRNLGEVHLRWWPLAVAGLILQLIPVPSRPGQADHWVAVALFVASYIVLLMFVAANLRAPGFPLIAVGFLLNILVIGLNGGMPVKDSALRQAAGSGYARAHARLAERGRLKHHLATPDDVLVPVSDVVGIGGPVASVYSPGDFLAYLGVGWAFEEFTRRPRSKRLSEGESGGPTRGRAGGPGPTSDPDPFRSETPPADLSSLSPTAQQ